MSGTIQAHAEILEQAQTYCEAVWYARTGVFEEMCHERFAMNLIEPEGPTYWDKASFYRARARPRTGRGACLLRSARHRRNGRPDRARASDGRHPRNTFFEDHLGFVNENGSWKLLTKVFRIKARLG